MEIPLLGTVQDLRGNAVERIVALTVEALGSAADPTLLPVATGQQRPGGAYDALGVAGASAGFQYPDPTSGAMVVKLSDPSSPENNSTGVHDYSEGGPYISLPWGAAGEMYTVYFRVRAQPVDDWAGYFLDFNITTGQFSNTRQVPGARRDLRFAFSNDPSTPQIAYLTVTSSSTVERFNTATMQIENIGNFPHSFPGRLGWLHQDRNDAWFVVGNKSSYGMAAWNSETGVEYFYKPSDFDDPHLDRDGHFVAIKRKRYSPECDCNPGNLDIMSLVDGSIDDTLDLGNSHPAGLRGYFVFVNQHGRTGVQRRVDASGDNRVDILDEPDYYGGSGHRAGQWIINNDVGISQWYLASHYGTGAEPGQDAIVLVRADGSDVRLLAHHYSNTDQSGDYGFQPHATISPDGRLVMWTSDMNVPGGRIDVLLAKVPT